jgi:hypothetical protein
MTVSLATPARSAFDKESRIIYWYPAIRSSISSDVRFPDAESSDVR